MNTQYTLRRQRGATLLISLIMLVVLTLFAVAGFNLSSVNLKIAGNFQDQKRLEAVAQQAIEQYISTATPFSLTPSGATISVSGYSVAVGDGSVPPNAPKCHYWATAKGYTKKIGELTPEDTDWEVKALATDALTGAQARVGQGVRIRLLAGNCPA